MARPNEEDDDEHKDMRLDQACLTLFSLLLMIYHFYDVHGHCDTLTFVLSLLQSEQVRDDDDKDLFLGGFKMKKNTCAIAYNLAQSF